MGNLKENYLKFTKLHLCSGWTIALAWERLCLSHVAGWNQNVGQREVILASTRIPYGRRIGLYHAALTRCFDVAYAEKREFDLEEGPGLS